MSCSTSFNWEFSQRLPQQSKSSSSSRTCCIQQQQSWLENDSAWRSPRVRAPPQQHRTAHAKASAVSNGKALHDAPHAPRARAAQWMNTAALYLCYLPSLLGAYCYCSRNKCTT